jgi:hypothetical protein
MAKIFKLNFDKPTISFIEAVYNKIKGVIKFGVMLYILRSVCGKGLIRNLQSQDWIFHGLKLFNGIIILPLDHSYLEYSYASVMSVKSADISLVAFAWSAAHYDE